MDVLERIEVFLEIFFPLNSFVSLSAHFRSLSLFSSLLFSSLLSLSHSLSLKMWSNAEVTSEQLVAKINSHYETIEKRKAEIEREVCVLVCVCVRM